MFSAFTQVGFNFWDTGGASHDVNISLSIELEVMPSRDDFQSTLESIMSWVRSVAIFSFTMDFS